MCYKAEKDCYISHLYDVLKANTPCVDCIETKKDDYLSEIDRICRGLPCFKRFFPCDENGTGIGSCNNKEALPCIPYAVCLEQIYEQCRNDPEATDIMNHLLEKLRRREKERVKASKLMDTKTLVKELSDFYNSVAAVSVEKDLLYNERLKAEEERLKAEAFQQRMKEHEISPEELAKLDEMLKESRREGKAKADEQRLEREAIKKAADEAAAAAAAQAAEAVAAAKKLQLAAAANPETGPPAGANPANAPKPGAAPAATAAASSTPAKPKKSVLGEPSKLADLPPGTTPDSQTPDPQPSLKVKAGSKEAKEIAKTASQKNRKATENKDKNPQDTVSEPWAEKSKNLRQITPKSFKKKRGHERDHKKSPWSWGDKLYDVRYHPPINDDSVWSPKSKEQAKIPSRTFREELESVPHAVKPIRESLQLKPLSAEWRTLIKRYSIKQTPE